MKHDHPSGGPVDLTNCDVEPIHIPGSIQPHGALLAFTLDGRLASRSANAHAMLGVLPATGTPLDGSHLTAEARAAIGAALADPDNVDALELTLPTGITADLTMNVSNGLLIAEFEPRGPDAPRVDRFAADAQRALERIQRKDSLDRLLEVTTEEVARLSGFDRVMAYRFHHDDSGEVVAEHKREGLDPLLGMRYPASDIPAQARRLYTINPLRLIVDVAYRPAPIEPNLNPVTGGPIDLARSVLRSVSPIHVEYLTNMGVRASMSISIVVKDRLWGLFACHHYSPHFVPHAVRKSCQLLSQVVSVLVERALATGHARTVANSMLLHTAIVDRAKADEDMVHALAIGDPSIAELIPCSGAAVSAASQVAPIGEGAPRRADLARIVSWLGGRGVGDLFQSGNIAHDAPEIAAACGDNAGLLAIRYGTEANSYVIWFRPEQVATVRWAGQPDKQVAMGPNGPRLSPRGSFEEWRQEVRGRSAPWSESDLEAAERLRRALVDVSAGRLQEVVRARDTLIAMLGHDLRNPLQAISMSVEVLRRDGSMAARAQNQISSSSGRMARLITHVLDVSRIQSGIGLGIAKVPTDIPRMLNELVEEARAAHPGAEVVTELEGAGEAEVDADRLGQVISNLLSNARHHGEAGKSVTVTARRDAGNVTIRVTNHGRPLVPGALERLFEPFKPSSLHNPNNPRGLGMGLYIASSIVREHGGTLTAESGGGVVTFTITLPAG